MDIANYPIDNSRRAGSGSLPTAAVPYVGAVEQGGTVKRTVLTLVNLPVSVTSVTTGAGVGGTQIFDFPEGYLHVMGCTAELALSVAVEGDFTDGTPEGQAGIGSLAPANADALGTDATDDDFGTATDFTMADYVDASVSIPSEATRNVDGTTAAANVFVNLFVDAADIDNGTTTVMYVNGTVKLTWVNLGDTVA